MTPTTPDPFDQPEFYSGIPTKRFMAWVVDALLVLIASVLILPFTAFTGLFFFPLLMLMVGFTYRVATLASGSATWGMRLFGMELRTARDEPLDLARYRHGILFCRLTRRCRVVSGRVDQRWDFDLRQR